jgi:hypothetical protein
MTGCEEQLDIGEPRRTFDIGEAKMMSCEGHLPLAKLLSALSRRR